MPAIRNAILMILANKTLEGPARAAKARSSSPQEIMREAVRPMGIEVAAPEPMTAAPADEPRRAPPAASGDERRCADARHAGQAKSAAAPRRQRNPIQHVHFSSFIIQ